MWDSGRDPYNHRENTCEIRFLGRMCPIRGVMPHEKAIKLMMDVLVRVFHGVSTSGVAAGRTPVNVRRRRNQQCLL
ncbi:hypothetical protein [Corynebacterium efficiens YS-314]|uniref:Uncharacterized protein n=1 Tax=Corynebacterium efficiens (strain DSM 44549 / YS-314 / AJ 12310 / JCM 11189 / NBRC 100395) TaxID=196164 RepID=Q8FPI5_COREF|nr:hypothetical protein [Corynebacterium efficiens YS-314]